ncbi:MAG TPA: penicillin-binding protein 2 [Candidatus Limnocylindrales bacterium]
MPGRTDSRRRLLLLLLGLVLVSGSLVARLGWWQLNQQTALAAQAVRQTSTHFEIPSRRGSIYDRSGTVLLASTVDRSRLVAAPGQLDAQGRAAGAAVLVRILGLTGADAAELTQKMATARQYVILARGLEPALADQVAAAVADHTLSQVFIEPEPVRVYPQVGGGPSTTLAAQLIGFVNRDGAGQYGVEQRYQDLLAGSPTVMTGQSGSSGVNAQPPQVLQPGVPGTDLRLTIDAHLQRALEQEVLAASVADKAVSVSALVMDPHTGEIYAEGTYPSYDENDYAAIAARRPVLFQDPIVSQPYEPGSVFKLLTLVAGLETKTITPSTKIEDATVLSLDKGVNHVSNANHRSMGLISVRDAIAWSRNVIAAKIALGLAPTTQGAAVRLFNVWKRFGIGLNTGIDVAGEQPGIVHDPAGRTWRQIDVANGAFGQGVAVTPVQLATAYAAMLNGGELVQPYVVKAMGDSVVSPSSRGEAIPASMTPTLMAIMEHVVSTVPYYRAGSLVPGYVVGGKTGTAQIWDPQLDHGKGAWRQDAFNYSFVGFIARHAGHPDVVIAVEIHEGHPTGRSSLLPVESFQLFRRIATDTMATPALVSELSATASASGAPAAPAGTAP